MTEGGVFAFLLRGKSQLHNNPGVVYTRGGIMRQPGMDSRGNRIGIPQKKFQGYPEVSRVTDILTKFGIKNPSKGLSTRPR